MATAVWLSSFLVVALLYVSRRFRASVDAGRAP
jgi:hypothetical protein